MAAPWLASTERRRLLAALADEPGDRLCLLALADWHEESGLPHQSALLRLAYALGEVPFPPAPSPECEAFFADGKARRLRGREGCLECRAGVCLHTPYSGMAHPRRASSDWWPRCPGWDGPGRLPGIAAARRLAMRGSRARRRCLSLCELYACGAVTAAERDAGFALGENLPAGRGDWFLLRSGAAGRPWHVLVAAESRAGDPARQRSRRAAGAEGLRGWLSDYDARYAAACRRRASARTYHRSLAAALVAGRPWEHAAGAYSAAR